MKLIKLNSEDYIIVDDYNTNEPYDSRIKKGMLFYKDEYKDVIVAEYSPSSKVSRPVIASTNPYADAGIKNGYNLPMINSEQLNDRFQSITKKQTEWDAEIEMVESWNYTTDFSKLEKGMILHKISGSEVVVDKIIVENEKIIPMSNGVPFRDYNDYVEPIYAYEKIYKPKVNSEGYINILKIK